MSELTRQVDRAIREHNLLKPEDPLIVAVSGGLDSMVLLHLLQTLSKEQRWLLHVAHFNHLLRDDSNIDEALVKKTANELALPFLVDRADVRQFAKAEKLSIEMAARQRRHAFLARVAREHGIHKVALAHHADDQVELFFLRLLRGTGGSGLGGMQWSSPSPIDSKVQLIRPLLDVSKTDLREYAAEQKIAFRDDSTNECIDILRNRIRHELLPLLERNYQPALDRTTRRLMAILRDESEFLESILARELKEGAFEKAPVALQRRFIQSQPTALGLPPNFALIDELRRSEAPIMIAPEKVLARNAAGVVHLQPVPRASFDSERLVLAFIGDRGSLSFKDVVIGWEIASPADSIGARMPTSASSESQETLADVGIRAPSIESFDADKIGDSIVLRHWQPGDRFQPIGMAQPVKLQDFFVNQKVPRPDRHKLLIAATASGDIVWVEGLRIAEGFKLDKHTKRVLKWSWHRG